MSQSRIIEVEGLHFRYNEEDTDWALQGVHLDVFEGEWLALTGHNGSGKSTLAKCLNSLLVPEKGTVLIEGMNANDPESLWEIRRRVGMVFQNPDNQFVGTTVRDDVAFGMENHGIERQEMIERIKRSLALVQMTDYAEKEPHHLSGGQKQRVAIAGIIALEPRIIVLDEATSMLDPQGKQEVLNIVRDLNKEKGITVISITHDLEEASIADRMVVMESGKIVREGTPREVFEEPDLLKDIGLDLPFAVKMRQALMDNGLSVSRNTFLQDELVEELWKLK